MSEFMSTYNMDADIPRNSDGVVLWPAGDEGIELLDGVRGWRAAGPGAPDPSEIEDAIARAMSGEALGPRQQGSNNTVAKIMVGKELEVAVRISKSRVVDSTQWKRLKALIERRESPTVPPSHDDQQLFTFAADFLQTRSNWLCLSDAEVVPRLYFVGLVQRDESAHGARLVIVTQAYETNLHDWWEKSTYEQRLNNSPEIARRVVEGVGAATEDCHILGADWKPLNCVVNRNESGDIKDLRIIDVDADFCIGTCAPPRPSWANVKRDRHGRLVSAAQPFGSRPVFLLNMLFVSIVFEEHLSVNIFAKFWREQATVSDDDFRNMAALACTTPHHGEVTRRMLWHYSGVALPAPYPEQCEGAIRALVKELEKDEPAPVAHAPVLTHTQEIASSDARPSKRTKPVSAGEEFFVDKIWPLYGSNTAPTYTRFLELVRATPEAFTEYVEARDKVALGNALTAAVTEAGPTADPTAVIKGVLGQAGAQGGSRRKGTKRKGTKCKGTKRKGTKRKGTNRKGTRRDATRRKGTRRKGSRRKGTRRK
jgi:hypothetical protein